MSWLHDNMNKKGVWLQLYGRRIPHGHGGIDGSEPGPLVEDVWEVLPMLDPTFIVLKNIEDSRTLMSTAMTALLIRMPFTPEAIAARIDGDGFSQYRQTKMNTGERHPFWNHERGTTYAQWWDAWPEDPFD